MLKRIGSGDDTSLWFNFWLSEERFADLIGQGSSVIRKHL